MTNRPVDPSVSIELHVEVRHHP